MTVRMRDVLTGVHVGTERALKKTSDNVVILQNFASAKDGDTEAKRKEHINNVCQAMGDGKKPKKIIVIKSRLVNIVV